MEKIAVEDFMAQSLKVALQVAVSGDSAEALYWKIMSSTATNLRLSFPNNRAC